MQTLVITVSGEQSDLDFLRERMLGGLQDVAAEYEQNLDGPVEVDWEWGKS